MSEKLDLTPQFKAAKGNLDMKTAVLLVLAMFIFSSCNSEETKTVNNAGNTTDGGGADISGIDVKGLIVNRFNKTGICTEIGGTYYRTRVYGGDGMGANMNLKLRFLTFPDSVACENNDFISNGYDVNFRLDKAVILEDGHIKIELTVDSHDPDPRIGHFDAYNSNLTSISNEQKEYWRIELDLTLTDSDVVLPRGQDFLAPSSAETPNEGEETYVTITNSLVE